MGIFDFVGDAIGTVAGAAGGAWNWAKGAVSDAGDAVTGHNGFQGTPYQVDQNAYQLGGNPNETPARVAMFNGLAGATANRQGYNYNTNAADADRAAMQRSSMQGDADRSNQMGLATQTARLRGQELNQMGLSGQTRNMGIQQAGQADQARQQQQGFANMMNAQAMGNGPSVAQLQLRQGMDQSLAAQQSLAASARGGGLAAMQAQRTAAQQGSSIAANTNQQAAQLRAQEMLQARGQLGGALSDLRGQDLSQQQAYQGMRGQDLGSVAALGNVRQEDLGQQNLYNTARNTDIAQQQTYNQSRGLGLQQAQTGAQLQLQQQQQNDAMRQWGYNTSNQLLTNQQNANMQLQQINSANHNAAMGINSGVAQNNSNNQASFFGNLMNSAGGAAAAVSDERQKTNISPMGDGEIEDMLSLANDYKSMVGGAAPQKKQNGADSSSMMTGMAAAMSDERNKTAVSGTSTKSFLDHLEPYSYQYKNQAFGAGPQVGVMAQDVEKSPMGKTMVMNTPVGKALDMKKGFGLLLASAADMNKRLAKLEGR